MEKNRTILIEDNMTSLLRRAMIHLTDKDWLKADTCCERVLDEEPENSYAYIIKLMASLNIQDEMTLWEYERRIDSNPLFEKAVKFADDALRNQLSCLAKEIAERIEKRQRELKLVEITNSYHKALNLMGSEASEKELRSAISFFEKAEGYQDADERKASCEERIRTIEREAREREAASSRKRTRLGILTAVAIIAVITLIMIMRHHACSARAYELEQNLKGKSFSCSYSDADFKPGELTASYVEYIDETLLFRRNDVSITTVTSISYSGSIIVINGQKKFDEVVEQTDYVESSKVTVPLFGDPYIMIDGRYYEIVANSNDVPTELVRGNLRFK